MKPRIIRWLLIGLAACAFLAFLGYWSREVWIEQLRAYALGTLEVRAQRFGLFLPEADEIEVAALDLTFKGEHPRTVALGFPVFTQGTLRGEEAREVVRLWRGLRRGRVFAGMCHDPVYVLRFRRGGHLLLETSVCWHCHNYTIPIGIFGRAEYGFDADRADAQTLLRLLQTHIPPPPEPDAQASAASTL